MKLLPTCLLAALSLTLGACASPRLREGIVVSKHARKGICCDPMNTVAYFHLPQPDVYWVDVRGENAKGKMVKKHIIVFRADWRRIQVGDHWSASGGFETG